MTKKFWQFKAKEEAPSIGELLLYGDISSSTWWGDEITPAAFAQDLKSLGDVSVLNIYINSGGGDVFAGQAIYSMLKRHPARKNVYVDGLAASIASVIAMAGDTVFMPKNAMMMVHKAWTMAIGNANDLRKLADDMDKIDESILITYQDKTGLEKDKIVEMVNAETWLTAEEAVAYGFADQIEEAKQLVASLSDGQLKVNGQTFNLNRYRNPPDFKVRPTNTKPPGVQNEGRTLSTANEQRIRNASDLLVEVLDQLEKNSTNDGLVNSLKPNPKVVPANQDLNRQGLPVHLFLAQISLNRRRLANV